jgi:hypothetical protein
MSRSASSQARYSRNSTGARFQGCLSTGRMGHQLLKAEHRGHHCGLWTRVLHQAAHGGG